MNSNLQKLTPVLACAAIEPVLAFWKPFGLEVAVSVPHGEVLGFVILQGDGVELMYQTHASLREDAPTLAEAASGASLLFIQVSDIDQAASAAGDAPEVFARRQTFYGATEFAVRDPAGHVVTFAQFAESANSVGE